jgi:hypothetical protein
MSIMLAAADLGIGSAHAGVHDHELARRLLGFPEDRFCPMLITLGVPADRPLTPVQRHNRAPSTTSCTAAAGSGRALVVTAVRMALEHPLEHPLWSRPDRRGAPGSAAGG